MFAQNIPCSNVVAFAYRMSTSNALKHFLYLRNLFKTQMWEVSIFDFFFQKMFQNCLLWVMFSKRETVFYRRGFLRSSRVLSTSHVL